MDFFGVFDLAFSYASALYIVNACTCIRCYVWVYYCIG